MTPQTTTQPTPGTSATADTLARIDAWMHHLADETDHAAQGAEITRYLRVLARFHHYSAHNCMLILLQRPEATRVAGYRAWQALGRQVTKGSKGITILCPAPIRDKDKPKDDPDAILAVRFRIGYVFDLADTEGDALPDVTPHAVEGQRYTDLLRRLIAIAERGGLTVSFKDRLVHDANGVSYGDGRIDLREGTPSGNLCKTLLHEITHERMHCREERQTFTTQQMECQAEAVAYCVCQALDVPTPNTPTYLALYRVDRAVLAANLDAIRRGVAALLDEVAPALEGKEAA